MMNHIIGLLESRRYMGVPTATIEEKLSAALVACNVANDRFRSSQLHVTDRPEASYLMARNGNFVATRQLASRTIKLWDLRWGGTMCWELTQEEEVGNFTDQRLAVSSYGMVAECFVDFFHWHHVRFSFEGHYTGSVRYYAEGFSSYQRVVNEHFYSIGNTEGYSDQFYLLIWDKKGELVNKIQVPSLNEYKIIDHDHFVNESFLVIPFLKDLSNVPNQILVIDLITGYYDFICLKTLDLFEGDYDILNIDLDGNILYLNAVEAPFSRSLNCTSHYVIQFNLVTSEVEKVIRIYSITMNHWSKFKMIGDEALLSSKGYIFDPNTDRHEDVYWLEQGADHPSRLLKKNPEHYGHEVIDLVPNHYYLTVLYRAFNLGHHAGNIFEQSVSYHRAVIDLKSRRTIHHVTIPMREHHHISLTYQLGILLVAEGIESWNSVAYSGPLEIENYQMSGSER